MVPFRGRRELVENIVHECEHIEALITRARRYRQSMHILLFVIGRATQLQLSDGYLCQVVKEGNRMRVMSLSGAAAKSSESRFGPLARPDTLRVPRCAAFLEIHSSS